MEVLGTEALLTFDGIRHCMRVLVRICLSRLLCALSPAVT